MKTDSLFYFLFQSVPSIFFEMIGQAPDQSKSYEFRSVEIKQTAFRIDGVFLPPKEASNQPVYFVEVQFQKDPYLYQRLFAEIFLFLEQNPTTTDWQAVVIYPKRSLEPQETYLYRTLLSSSQIIQIYLDEIEETPSRPLGVKLVQLIVEPQATASEKAKQLIKQAQQAQSLAISVEVIIELVQTIIVYKFPHLGHQEVEAMLGLSELKQTKVYQEALEEGIQQGEQSLILRQLVRRLESIAPELQAEIQALPLAQLEELGEALLDFSDISDLQNWLVKHRPPQQL